MSSNVALRAHKYLLGVVLVLIGGSVAFDHELGVRQLVLVDALIAALLVGAGVICLIAATVNHEYLYQLSYIIVTTALAIWTFVLAAYALYGLVPWGRVFIFLYVWLQNIILLPYLLTDWRADAVLHRASREASERRADREERNGT